jgi:hypothetical protein
MYKNLGIYGPFVLLVLFLLVKPRVIYNVYNNILGRVCLIGLVIFLTINNITLGLLSALCLIIASNMFFIEGMTIGSDDTDDTDDDTTKDTTKVLTKDVVKDVVKDAGVDRQSIHEAIAAKSSATLPTSTENFTSENVGPNDTEKIYTSV